MFGRSTRNPFGSLYGRSEALRTSSREGIARARDERDAIVSARRDFAGHEEIIFRYDKASGLKAIVAIHSRELGPAFGGCRMQPYPSEREALRDALRLSRAMTYKAAVSGLAAGGGKSVIIGDPRTGKNDALLRAMGRFVGSLGGRYIIGADSGTSSEDMRIIRQETRHVIGAPDRATRNRLGNADPAYSTAYGVRVGIEVAVKHALGRDDLVGLRVAIQGLGNVGFGLAQQLKDAGALIWASDIDDEKLRRAIDELGAMSAAPGSIYGLDVDVFAPCAMGGIINDTTLHRLRARIVAGSANNQLAESRHGDELARQGILYAPDYIINAGGLIHAYHERIGSDRKRVLRHVGKIYDTLMEVFGRARRKGRSTPDIADALAERRLRWGRLPLGNEAPAPSGIGSAAPGHQSAD